MQIVTLTDDVVTIQFSRDEFGILRGCAVHVLETFAMGDDYDITNATGWTIEEAKNFREKIRLAFDTLSDSTIIYKFPKTEVRYLIIILADTIKYIDWEFQTLTGYTLDETRILNQELKSVLS